MRTEVVSQEDRLCVYELSMHTKGLYSDEKESKTFKHHRISEMYPFPHAIINISANSSFQPHPFSSFRNNGFILTLTMTKYF